VTEAALLIALLLHRPPGLVATVYDMAGLSGVVVCEYESQFCVTAWKKEAAGGSSYGVWQLWSECHTQFRDDLLLHLVYGAEFWKACLEKSCRVSVQGGCTGRQRGRQVAGGAVRFGALPSIAVAYSIYNSGSPWRSIIKGRQVEAKYNSLSMYLWRRLR
jgi:hypothetical protein